MDSVRLNGRPLQATLVPVNPALDRDATKAYLGFRKDGLDSLGVEVKGQHKVLVGRGLPHKIEAGDRLEIGGEAARYLYSENEVNDYTEGFMDAVRSNKGAATLLLGAATFAGGAYLASLFGLLAFPVFLAMLIAAGAGAAVGLAALGSIEGFKARGRPTDLTVTDRLKETSLIPAH